MTKYEEAVRKRKLAPDPTTTGFPRLVTSPAHVTGQALTAGLVDLRPFCEKSPY
jgi:hypothetical protein